MNKILVFLLLASCIEASFAQQKADSLMHYLDLSAKNNPTVLQKLDEYQAALQKVPQASSLSDPELTVGVFLSPMELISGNQVADIQLMQMFPWFGVLKNAKDEMSLMAKAKYESFRDAKLQVFYEVQRTWYELQKVQQDILISEKNIELLKTIERVSQIKFRTGTVGGKSLPTLSGAQPNTPSGNTGMNTMGGGSGATPVSAATSMPGPSMGSSSSESGLAGLYRIQIEIGDLENNIAMLKSQQSTLVATFNSFLNRSLTTTVYLPKDLLPDSSGMNFSNPSDSLLANNPMLGMLKYEQESLNAREKMVSRMGYPMVGVGVDYSLINKNPMATSSMNGKDMIMPMVKVTLPIYRKKYKAIKTEAGLLRAATAHGYQAAANSLQTDYYQALQTYQDADRKMKLYESQSLLAKQSLNITIKSFSASGASLTDVLQIRQQLLDYELKQVEAVASFNTAIAWLKRLNANFQIQ